MKISPILLLLLLCLSGYGVSAQSWNWAKTVSGVSLDEYQIATDPSGNVFMAGVTYNVIAGTANFGSGITLPIPSGFFSSFCVKYSSTGTPLWALGINVGNPFISSIATDPSGNVIIYGTFAGHTISIGSFTLTNAYTGGYAQYFLAKVSPSGTVLWAINDGEIENVTYIHNYIEMVSAGQVTTDDTGNIYINGYYPFQHMHVGPITITNVAVIGLSASMDVFVAKYNPSGVPVWATDIGGPSDEYAMGLTVASDGSVYVCGCYNSDTIRVGASTITSPYPLSTFKAYIARLSPSGTPLWAQGGGGLYGAIGIGLNKDRHGNVFMIGDFYDTSVTFGATTITRTYPGAVPKPAIFLVEYSSSGVITWSKTMGSPTREAVGYAITVPPCGSDIWICGSYREAMVMDAGDTLALIPGLGIIGANPDQAFFAGYHVSGSGGIFAQNAIASGGDDQNSIACDAAGNIFFGSDFEALSTPTTLNIGTLSVTASGGTGLITGGLSEIEYPYIVKYGNVRVDTTAQAHDTVICGSDNLILTGLPGYTGYYWNNGSTDSVCTVDSAGTYYVYNTGCSSVVVDTFHVLNTASDTLYRHTDTAVCAGGSPISLFPPLGFTADLWNTGSRADTLKITSGGRYWVFAQQSCELLIDTFNVVSLTKPVLNLGSDTGFCTGHTLVLQVNQPQGYSYLWSTGSTDNTITISKAGVYWLTVSDGMCKATDTIEVTEAAQPPPAIHLGKDTSICSGYPVILNANAAGASILWSNGATGQTIDVAQSGTYWATATNGCGTSSDSITVKFEDCNIWFPSVFTPNGDGLNDIIKVLGSNLQAFKNFSLSIYNRWGQRVFFTQDITAGWDGTFNAEKADVGTYFYMILYTLEGNKHMMKGDIELIR